MLKSRSRPSQEAAISSDGFERQTSWTWISWAARQPCRPSEKNRFPRSGMESAAMLCAAAGHSAVLELLALFGDSLQAATAWVPQIESLGLQPE